jgi:hypothetical protein
VTSGEIIRSIFFAGDQLFGVEQLSVGTGSDLVDYRRLEIQEDTSWHVVAGTSLREESVDSIIHPTDGLVRWHFAVWLDTVL